MSVTYPPFGIRAKLARSVVSYYLHYNKLVGPAAIVIHYIIGALKQNLQALQKTQPLLYQRALASLR